MTRGFDRTPAENVLSRLCLDLPESMQYLLGDVYVHTVRPWVFGGPRFRSCWRRLSQSEWWSRDELERLQWRKFKRLLEHAYRHVRWYRRGFDRLNLTPDDIRSYEDLPRVPVLTREDARDHVDELIAEGVKREDLISRGTAGSTGTPVEALWDARCYRAARAASARWKRFAGCDEITDRCVWVRRAAFPAGSDGSDFFGRYDPAANELLLASTNMTPTVLAEYVRRVRDFRPKCIQGYASGIYVLASYLLENGIHDVRIDAAFPSADPLYPHYRRVIERVFGCEVFENYGMAERTVSAGECAAHDGMHVDMELCLMEVLDDHGRQVFDETGEIIGTNLENYAMPLIRYRTNDLGRLTRRRCRCGRESPLLEHLVGRTEDMIHTPDGRRFRLVRVYDLGTSVPEVREFQFVQETVDRLTVNMVKRRPQARVDTTAFLGRLRSIIGNGIRIEVRFVDAIPRTRGGKLKLLVSHVDKGVGTG